MASVAEVNGFKNIMAATLEAKYVFGTEDLESRAKVVKFAVIQGNEREGAGQEH